MAKKLTLLVGFLLGAIFIQAQSWLWGVEGVGDGHFESIASDRQNNCYIAGLIPNDTIQFGKYTLLNSTITNRPYSSNFDGFLVKYDTNGNVLWAKQTFEKNINPNIVNDAPESVCIDWWGNVYLAGNFVDTLFVGNDTLINENVGYYPENTYLVKYSSNGNFLWAKQAIDINDSSLIDEESISSDSRGNIYVTGAFWDSVKMGSELLTSPANYFYPFIAKYDSSGNIKWAKQATGHTKSGALCYAIANDKVSNVFIAGIFGDTITFGSFKLGSIPSYLSGNCFIAKYDSSGNVLWAKNPKLSSNWSGCVGWALATDQSGNVYVGGDFIDTVVFDQDTIIGPPSSEYSVQSSFFLVKYDPNGNVLWAKYAKILDSNDWDLWCLSSDKLNHIYLSVNGGYQQSKIVFGEDTLSLYDTAKYDNASILLKLDSNGKTICGSILPIGADEGNHVGVTSDTTGKFVYFGGIAASVAVFGKDTIDPFDYPLNAIQRLNYFPFVARWEACDSSILTVINRNKSLTEKVILYPNPNNGKFTIALQNVNESMVIVIYNVLGEEICQTKLNLGNTEISLSGQPGGIYFYRVIKETGEFIGNGKIIIEK